MTPRPPRSTLFPYTTLFRSLSFNPRAALSRNDQRQFGMGMVRIAGHQLAWIDAHERSEEHTSELQSPVHLVCRLLLEKKKRKFAHLPDADKVIVEEDIAHFV